MRSFLFVPGHDERKLAKGLECCADALILDLEDAVPDAEKPRARAITGAFIATHRARLPLFVRINALDSEHALIDLAAVVSAMPHGVVLPKCASAHDVDLLGHYLTALETREGVTLGSTRILGIATETAAAVLAASSYAERPNPRLYGLLWGAEDLAADVGATSNRGADGAYAAPFVLARSLALLAATAAGVIPIDAVYPNFRDPLGLKSELDEALRDGFCAKAAIHPDQIAPINQAFTPSPAELDWAKRVVAAFAAAPTQGALAVDGKMLDRPHLRSAQRLLARAAR